MSTTHAQQDKQASLSDALTKSKEQKKGGPLIDMLSNSDKLMVQKNLPNQIKSEMEEKFNANLDHVKLYESKLVEDTGAHAYAGGASIAFAPGKLDFSSFEGKKLLGHELSHVVNKTSEFEADSAGLQVATGESAFSTTASSFDSMESVITPMSCSDGISDFAGPVAAKKNFFSGLKMKNTYKNISADKSLSEEERLAAQMDLIEKLNESKDKKLLGSSEDKALIEMLLDRTSTQEKADASNKYFLDKTTNLYESFNVQDGISPENLAESESIFRAHEALTTSQGMRKDGEESIYSSDFGYTKSPFIRQVLGNNSKGTRTGDLTTTTIKQGFQHPLAKGYKAEETKRTTGLMGWLKQTFR